ncbi:hypothetical protein [Weissella sp. MSCH1]|uniref:hypothetical protein n=1 Tax=Weissella sp. MSCH1 TaxID=3383343 RepID=UPI003896C5EC
MFMKIIDVPENADYITAHEQINAGGSFLLQKYNVVDLPDAPTVAKNATVEKRVIELPADVIEGIQNAKTYWENVAGFVLNAPSIVFTEIRKSIGEPHASYDKVADILGSWYFGNIEFVEKKEPKFYVRVDVDGEEQSVAMWQNSDGESGIAFDVFMRNEPAYTETDADNLVAGLTALNARKVKVEE